MSDTKKSAKGPALRKEHDSMGEILVPCDKYWGAQTQRSFENFRIGTEKMPPEVISAFAILKKSAAQANCELGTLPKEKAVLIEKACEEILDGSLDGNFPLAVWQTGSGTQSNMNINEVIAHRGNELAKKTCLHPNDDVNKSQSSNDTFPTAMHIAAIKGIEEHLFPRLDALIKTFKDLEKKHRGIVTTGRTHLQDAVPIAFSQEISGWRTMLERSRDELKTSEKGLLELALGGTAVGTGLNAPKDFDRTVAAYIAQNTGYAFKTAPNKFHALTSLDDMVFSHGALKALAANLMKIANDVRWLASGPRCGLGEIQIPENEPGSSIMPGKVNPVIPEVMNQIAFKVIGNELCVTMADEAAQMELNAMEPVMAQCCFESAELLINGFDTLRIRCVDGITANEEKCLQYVRNSIGVVTALNPIIGYKNSTKIAKEALETGRGVYELVLEHGILNRDELDEVLRPENMIHPVKLDIKPRR